jgi:hypothetical protein
MKTKPQGVWNRLLTATVLLILVAACQPGPAASPDPSTDGPGAPADQPGEPAAPPAAPGTAPTFKNLVSLMDTHTLTETFSRVGWYVQAPDDPEPFHYLWQFDGQDTVNGQQTVKILFTTGISGSPRYDGVQVWLNPQGEAVRFEDRGMVMEGEAAHGMFTSEWIAMEFLYGVHVDLIMQANLGLSGDHVRQEQISTGREQIGGLTVDVTRMRYTVQADGATMQYNVTVADFGDFQLIVGMEVELETPDGEKFLTVVKVDQLERR